MSRKRKNPSTGIKLPKLKRVTHKMKRTSIRTGKHRV